MIKIICDSMSDVPAELLDKYDVDVLPINIIIDEKEYLDGVDISNDEYYKILRTSTNMPKTSQITYVTFKEKFESYTTKGIDVLYVGGSSKASGTYQSATIASKDTEGPGKVFLFDTNSLSVCAGLFVAKAGIMKNKGLSAEEISKELEMLKGRELSAFFVDDLKYLQKGGRISSVKASIGTLLKITPILKVDDGLVVQDSTVRGKKLAFNSLVKINNSDNNLENKLVFIGYCDNEKNAIEIESKIKEIANPDNVYKVKIGAGVSTHSGPSIIGVASI